MFTNDELLREYKVLSLMPMELVSCITYGDAVHSHLMLDKQGSNYYLLRGWVADFDSAMQFYCTAAVCWEIDGVCLPDWEKYHLGWMSAEIEASLCIPIAPEEFSAEIQSFFLLDKLRQVVSLPSMDEFVGALRMKDGWDYVILAEYKREFIYLGWSAGS